MSKSRTHIAANSQEAADDAERHLSNSIGHATSAAVDITKGNAKGAGHEAAAAGHELIEAVKSVAQEAGHLSQGN